MYTSNKPDRDSRRSNKRYSTALIGVVYVLSLAAMFMFGCFVIGPWLSRTHNSAITTTPSAHLPVHSLHPTQPSDVHTPPLPKVTIPEPSPGVPDPPQVTNPAQPTVPQYQVSSDSSSAIPQDDTTAAATTVVNDEDIRPGAHADLSDKLHRVRAGTYTDRANADDLSRKLMDAGFTPTIYRVERSDSSLYVVQVGAFASRENADDMAQSLRQAGFEATISTDN